MIFIYFGNEKNEVKNVEEACCKNKKIDTVLMYLNSELFADETGCNIDDDCYYLHDSWLK